jgi:hypothetical protein
MPFCSEWPVLAGPKYWGQSCAESDADNRRRDAAIKCLLYCFIDVSISVFPNI